MGTDILMKTDGKAELKVKRFYGGTGRGVCFSIGVVGEVIELTESEIAEVMRTIKLHMTEGEGTGESKSTRINYCPVCGTRIKELQDGTIQTCTHVGTRATDILEKGD